MKGPLKHGHVRLGQPEDRKMGHSGLPRRGCCTPRRRKATPRLACDLKQRSVMTYLGSVS